MTSEINATERPEDTARRLAIQIGEMEAARDAFLDEIFASAPPIEPFGPAEPQAVAYVRRLEADRERLARLAAENIALRAAAEARILEMRPGNRVVCTFPGKLSQQDADILRARFRNYLDIPGSVRLVFCDDTLADVAEEPDTAAGHRIAALEALAAEILASYVKRDDGYRGRVGQVQVARWRDRLGGS